MDERMKIGAAVVGGYILGRTKKGRAAIRLAMWLAGSDYRPGDLVRTGALRVTQSAEAAKLVDQLRGPVMLAAQRAAQAAVEGQVQKLAQGIQGRAESLTGAAAPSAEVAAEAAVTVTRPVKAVSGAVRDKLEPQQREGGEQAAQSDEAEAPENEQEEDQGGEEQGTDLYDEGQADEDEEQLEAAPRDEQADRPRARREQDSGRVPGRKPHPASSGAARNPSSGREAARARRGTQ